MLRAGKDSATTKYTKHSKCFEGHMNLELAKGEQALIRLWQIQRSTFNIE
jgi:hypothetical protein